MNLINEKKIIVNTLFKNKEEIFKHISQMAFKHGDSLNAKTLEDDFNKRESQLSTGLENEFAIPHAISASVTRPTIYIVINKNEIPWKTLDNKDKVKYVFALLVPKKATNIHLKLLAAVATKLNSDKFKKLIINHKVKLIVEEINNISLQEATKKLEKNNYQEVHESALKIVGVTSCAAGIAHTYMARDRIMEACKKNAWACKIETRGTIGPENILSKADIEEADIVFIASDLKIDLNQFAGKHIINTDTNNAIRNATTLINKAIKNKINNSIPTSKIKKGDHFDDNVIFNLGDKAKNKLMQALMTAIGYMLPITIAGGILMAIPNIYAAHNAAQHVNDLHYNAWDFVGHPFMHGWFIVGTMGLKLMLPIFGMYLAYSIAGRSAMAAALIGTYLINDASTMKIFLPQFITDYLNGQGGNAGSNFSPQAGFLGAIIIGLFVGYLVQAMKWVNWPKMFKPVIPILIIPVLSTFITYVFTVYVAAIPLIFIMFEFFKMLHSASNVSPVLLPLIGMLFAGMIAFDLGGPLNKTAYVVALAIYTTAINNMSVNHESFTSLPYSDFAPQAAVNAAIGVPPLGAWLATVLFRKKFSNAERQTGQAAFGMGLVGISEGAIPFAITNPIKAITANVVGAVCAGGIVVAFQCRYIAGLGSPLGTFLGYIPAGRFTYIGWLIGTISGSLITALIFGFWRPKVVEYEEAFQQRQAKKETFYKNKHLKNKKEIFKYNFLKLMKNFGHNFIMFLNLKNWIRDPQMHGDPFEYKIEKYKQNSLMKLKKRKNKIERIEKIITGFGKLIIFEKSEHAKNRFIALRDKNNHKLLKLNKEYQTYKELMTKSLVEYTDKINAKALKQQQKITKKITL